MYPCGACSVSITLFTGAKHYIGLSIFYFTVLAVVVQVDGPDLGFFIVEEVGDLIEMFFANSKPSVEMPLASHLTDVDRMGSDACQTEEVFPPRIQTI